MFQQLVSHNDDIERLVKKGYAVGFDSSCMIVRDIPYLDDQRQLQIGAIVTKLESVDKERVVQTDHQIFFAGSVPYGLDEKPIPNLGGGSAQIPLSENYKDVVVQRSFSNKPKESGKFLDFFEKIESYVAIISGPAMELYEGVTPYTFRIDKSVVPDPIFKFRDTLTSRAEISDLSARFKDDIVAVIGLGGTGAYIIDFLVKTPVKEIRGFDLDSFHVHNAFRSPGKLDEEELGKTKAEVYQSRYDNFRHGVVIKPQFIDSACSDYFDGVTFAFVCVDKGSSRAEIFDLLLSKGIPFIDVGMGLNRTEGGSLDGLIRTTYYSKEHGQQVRDKDFAEETDNPDDLYKTNIQIGELNALNACLAIIKFKKLRGFYYQQDPYHHLLFRVGSLKTAMAGDSDLDENYSAARSLHAQAS